METTAQQTPIDGVTERWSTRLVRRAISCSVTGLCCALALSLSPLVLPLCALVDVVTRLSLTRAFAFVLWYLGCEVVGVVGALALWLRRLVQRPSWARWAAWNYALQGAWARALFGAAVRCFSLRVDVRGDEVCEGGPFLLLCRHVSVADTVLPAVFVAARHGRRLRTVLKRELLWDPCLDIVGQRVPNAFVDRGGTDSAAQIARVGQLARDLGPDDGVLIFPEGTRFTTKKLARLREKLDDAVRAGRSDVRIRDLAHRLTHVLPPQLGGVLAALAAAPSADVVICSHTGFEGIRTLGDLVRGTLVRRHLRVRFRRLSRALVPVEEDARISWLLGEWQQVDHEVATLMATASTSGSAQLA
jgi:1-acyl-sn-glycerol-3-phosphate acyltransferase